MKKGLLVVLSLVVLGYVGIKGFLFFSSKAILNNEAVFELYMDIDPVSIDAMFNLDPGTYNPKEHMVVCKLPVEVQGFKSAYREFRPLLGDINCKEVYNKKKHIKFKSYELKMSGAKLLLLKKTGHALGLFSESLGRRFILGARPIYFNYKKGAINHILLEDTGVRLYCDE